MDTYLSKSQLANMLWNLCFILLNGVSWAYTLPPLPIRSAPVHICCQCKFFLPNLQTHDLSGGKCILFPKTEADREIELPFLVDGKNKEKTTEYYYCSTARSFRDLCGEEGVKYVMKA